jgi:hypothetical protein
MILIICAIAPTVALIATYLLTDQAFMCRIGRHRVVRRGFTACLFCEAYVMEQHP